MYLGSGEQQRIRLIRGNRWIPWPKHHCDFVLRQSFRSDEEVERFQEQVSQFSSIEHNFGDPDIRGFALSNIRLIRLIFGS